MTRPGNDAVTVLVSDQRGDGEPSPGRRLDLERWRALAVSVLAAEEGVLGPAELAITFVGEDRIAELNADHMGQVGPTDVLSFPIDAVPDPVGSGSQPPRLLGDVVICPAVAARQAHRHGDADGELALLVVHGILHVLGLDHADPCEAAAMVERERDHLGRAGIRRP